MRVDKRKKKDGWWIFGTKPKMGPYTTKVEAVTDMRGLERSRNLSPSPIETTPFGDCKCNQCQLRRRFGSTPVHSKPTNNDSKVLPPSRKFSSPLSRRNQMKFKKSVAVDVLVALGSKTAGNWSEKRIVGKLTKFSDLDEESLAKLDKKQKKFAGKLIKSLAKDDTLEMDDDGDAAPADDGKAAKKDKKPKEPKEKKRGVVAIILECINATSEKKPTTFTAIIEKLQKELPDRDVQGMTGTAKAVHSWAPPEHGIVVAYGLGDDKDKVWKHGECEKGSKAINVSPMAALKQERKEKQKADKKAKKDAKSVPEKAKKDKKEKKKKDKKEKK